MSTGTETIIARGAWDLNSPAAYGGLVVWSDNREGKDFDIFGYDLQKKAEFPVSRAIGCQTQPAIYGMRVVWEDSRNQGVGRYDWNPDIYGVTLEDKPGPVVPVIGALSEVDAKIEIVWPHDAHGNPRPVGEATLASIEVDVFVEGTRLSVPPDWSGTVRLYRSLSNGVEELVVFAHERLIAGGGVIYPRWDFNNVNVRAAIDHNNKYYFRVAVDAVETIPNVWSHGADGRTYSPYIDVPTSGCTRE